MPNSWVEHVRTFAANHKLSYGCAITNPKCKAAYMKAYPTPEMIFDESVEISGLTDPDYKLWLKAFKAILGEHKLLRKRLSDDAVDEFLDLAQNRAFKPSVKTVMKHLKPLLEKDDVSVFKSEIRRVLAAVGHITTDSLRDLVNELLEARAYRPISEAQWTEFKI